MPNASAPELLPGTLDLLVLKVVATGTMHGYGIAVHIEQVSDEALRVEEGSLYPALHRMEEAGWLRAEWITKDQRQRLRVYRLTPEGAKQLSTEQSRWQAVTSAVNRVLRTV